MSPIALIFSFGLFFIAILALPLHDITKFTPLGKANRVFEDGDRYFFRFFANHHSIEFHFQEYDGPIAMQAGQIPEFSTNFSGRALIYNSKNYEMDLQANGYITSDRFFIGSIGLTNPPGAHTKHENEYWHFSFAPRNIFKAGFNTIAYLSSDIIRRLEYGTLLICAKFLFFDGAKTVPAIIVLGDSGIVSPRYGTDADQFLANSRLLFGVQKAEYMREEGKFKDGNNEKVVDLKTPSSRGIIGIAGDRIVFEEFEKNLRHMLSDHNARSAQLARDTKEQIHKLLEEQDLEREAQLVHAQIIDGRRETTLYKLKKAKTSRDALFGYGNGISEEPFLSRRENAKALGLGAEDERVQMWLQNTFGARNSDEKTLNRNQLETAMTLLANTLQEDYYSALGTKFRGYILTDEAKDYGEPSNKIVA